MIRSEICAACGRKRILGIMSWECAVDALLTARNIKMTILFVLSLLLFGFDKVMTYSLVGEIDLSFKNVSDACMFVSTMILFMNFLLSLYDRYEACRERARRAKMKREESFFKQKELSVKK